MIRLFNKVILILSLLIIPTQVLALSSVPGSDPTGKSQRYVIEKTPWLDPTACPENPGQTTPTTGIGKVYMVGDSITESTQGQLKTTIGAKGFNPIEINGKSSRRLSEGSTELDGITVFKNDEAKWKDAGTIIIALGTNGNVTEANIKNIIGKIKQTSSNTKVYWVNLGAVNRPAITNQNTLIQQLASEDYTVIDWASVVAQHPEYIDPGPNGLGVHPYSPPNGPDGRKAFADTVANALGSSTASDKTTVPEVFISIFKRAAQKYNTDPGLLATIYYVEHGRNFAEPPPPYGNGPAYASSPAGASGPFQFIPSTWSAYGEDGNSDGKVDVQDLTDAAFAAAHLLSSMGGTAGKSIGDVDNPYQENTYLPVMIGYNWGPLHVQRKDLPLPNETSNYIKYGSEAYPSISAQMGGAAPPTTTGCNNQQQPNNASSGSLQKVVEVAQAEFAAGANEADGSNLKYISRGHQEAWCADFVSWVLRESGFPFTGGIGENGWNVPTVEGVQAYFENQGAFHPARSGYTPQPGDVVIYNENKNPYPQHVNIVVEVNGGGMTTIGGNEGGKVSRNTHTDFNAGYITGFGTPGVKK